MPRSPVILTDGSYLSQSGKPYQTNGIKGTMYEIGKRKGFDVHKFDEESICEGFMDRAYQAFYYIRGGRVRYDGEALCQNGEEYPGVHPSWSAESPVVFFSFCISGNIARLLQNLLDEQAFKDERGETIPTSSDWIKGIYCLSTSINGLLTPYFTDKIKDSETYELVENSTYLMQTMPLMNYYEWLDSPLLRMYNDAKLQRYKRSWRDISLYQALTEIHPAIQTKRSMLYDMSIRGMREWNARIKSYPDTTYLIVSSRPAESTKLALAPGLSLYLPGYNYNFEVASYKPTSSYYPEFHQSEWIQNDGLVSSISQSAPIGYDAGEIYSLSEFLTISSLPKGKWNELRSLSGDHFGSTGFQWQGFSYNVDPQNGEVISKIYDLMLNA